MASDCKNCPFFDEFWESLLGDERKEKALLKAYYSHSLDISCFDKQLKLCSQTPNQICEILIKVLLKYSTQSIIELIAEDFIPFEITMADIPQFSDFEVCLKDVVDVSIRSGIDGISYDQMGFLLRTQPRNLVADRKYGENQAKTAVALGLMRMDYRHKFWVTPLGTCFYHLSDSEKKALAPKLCLYTPLVQNYFVTGQNGKALDGWMSILAKSTYTRRLPNVQKMNGIVKESIEDVYGS